MDITIGVIMDGNGGGSHGPMILTQNFCTRPTLLHPINKEVFMNTEELAKIMEQVEEKGIGWDVVMERKNRC